MSQSPFDPDTEFIIRPSDSPVSVDGYAMGEPKQLSCAYCSATVQITEDPTDPGVDDLNHDSDCPQRFCRSDWWLDHVRR